MRTEKEIEHKLKEFNKELRYNLRKADLDSQVKAEQYAFRITALEWVLGKEMIII